MMSFEEWLLKKQKMNLNWFNTMIPDKRVYWEKWHDYKARAAEFEAEATRKQCEEAAKEILALQ